MSIPLYVGFDDREAIAYAVFSHSVIENASEPVEINPLASNMLNGFDGQRDGTNAFIYSRFLIPALRDFAGWAIFADGDMLCQADIAELWNMRDDRYAVMVVKHDYKTKARTKYIGTNMESPNMDYPGKNQSSVILWNCSHPSNRVLTPDRVATESGSWLHRFSWLPPEQVGEIPNTWNWLVNEYESNPSAKLLHYTLGVPAIEHYADKDHAQEWSLAATRMMRCGY